MKYVITIEARMSATRLPGKVLFPISGQPALAFLISRLKKTECVDEIIVATTDNPVDAPIHAWAEALGVSVFQGSENDVMGRVLDAARTAKADVIIELTGDNPLIDPQIIEEAARLFAEGQYDYVSNVTERSYPLGMDTQVFSTEVLADAYSRTTDPLFREHVSLFIYKNPDLYRLKAFRAPRALQRPDLRLTLDTAEDYQVISKFAEGCSDIRQDFGLAEIIAFADRHPEISELNSKVAHKWV